MLSKIISGGQTGADRAALDVAISFGIDHGGFVPKGRKAEDGVIATGYNLTELETRRYAVSTEKNIVHSDGTLIISRGDLKGGSGLTRTMALNHDKPWFHLNLGTAELLAGAGSANSWIDKNSIEILNVAGPRLSEDPGIYEAAVKALKALLCLNLLGVISCSQGPSELFGATEAFFFPPTGFDEAVDAIESGLSLREKTIIPKLNKEDLGSLYQALGEYHILNFKLGSGNSELMDDCYSRSCQEMITEEDASKVILKAIWERIRKTYLLRAVR